MRIRLFENWDFNYEYKASHTPQVELIESNGKKFKEGILGVVRGEAFFGDSFSRNGRFYPKELWSNALKNPETKRNIERGLMFACIGHPENYSLDELLASGAVAAKIADIQYDGNVGIVEFHILDTEAGRILNTIFRSGSKPYVSTRAFGSFTNETVEKDGREYKKLNPNDFEMEAIDFVINPGFLDTNPKLVESMQSDIQSLKESGIKCKDGICSLVIENGEKMNKLEALDKNQLITMIENLKEELDYLMNENSEFSSFDAIVKTDTNDFKFLKQFVSYLELLLKFLRYDVRYIDEYEKFVTLTSNDVFSGDAIKNIKDFVEQLIEDNVDDSIREICKYLLKIIDAQDSSDKKEDIEEELDTMLESIVAMYYYAKNNPQEDINAKNKMINVLNKQLDFMKMTTSKLGEELVSVKEELKSKDEEIESIEERVAIMAKNLQKRNEEIIAKTEQLESLKEAHQSLKEELERNPSIVVEEKIVEKIVEVKDETIVEELSSLKEKHEQVLKENEQLKEQLKEFNEKMESLKESSEETSNELSDSLNESLAKKEKALNEAVNNLKELKIKYLQEKYKIQKQTVVDFCEKFEDDVVEEQIKRFIKLNKIAETKAPVGFDMVVSEKKQSKVQEKLSKLI